MSRLSCPGSDLHAASGARLIHNQAAQIRDIPGYPLGPCRARLGALSRQAWGLVAPTRVIHWGLVAYSYLYKNLIVTYRVKKSSRQRPASKRLSGASFEALPRTPVGQRRPANSPRTPTRRPVAIHREPSGSAIARVSPIPKIKKIPSERFGVLSRLFPTDLLLTRIPRMDLRPSDAVL